MIWPRHVRLPVSDRISRERRDAVKINMKLISGESRVGVGNDVVYYDDAAATVAYSPSGRERLQASSLLVLERNLSLLIHHIARKRREATAVISLVSVSVYNTSNYMYHHVVQLRHLPLSPHEHGRTYVTCGFSVETRRYAQAAADDVLSATYRLQGS